MKYFLIKLSVYANSKFHRLIHHNEFFGRSILRLSNVFHFLSLRFSILANNTKDYFLGFKQTTPGLLDLHKQIYAILRIQEKKYPKEMQYLRGVTCYQGLDLLKIHGARSTEQRFKDYNLYNLIKEDDYILDLGCNNGFLLLYSSYLFGCRGYGVDINPYTIEIGKKCLEYLNITNVKLEEKRIEDLPIRPEFTKVISFATHWTNDKNYRCEIRTHLERLYEFVKEGGMVLFESHMSHAADDKFHQAISESTDLFSFDKKKDVKFLDDCTRCFFILKKQNKLLSKLGSV